MDCLMDYEGADFGIGFSDAFLLQGNDPSFGCQDTDLCFDFDNCGDKSSETAFCLFIEAILLVNSLKFDTHFH